jgi:hypothetical protein
LEWCYEEELKAIEENGTWELTTLPLDKKAIGLKWMFKVKKDEQGAVVRHKARLVVKGFSQHQGIYYEEVFDPVARLEAVRLLLALAADQQWEVHHMDVKYAFLNGDLAEEVYVMYPSGFARVREENLVLRLKKALYGLHQTSRAWNHKLDQSMLSLGFQRCPSDPDVYYRGNKGATKLVLGVYVDDIVITGSNRQEIMKFKYEMKKLFKMSDLGLLHYYLGIEVKQQ